MVFLSSLKSSLGLPCSHNLTIRFLHISSQSFTAYSLSVCKRKPKTQRLLTDLVLNTSKCGKFISFREAGHAKWQNVAHIKAEKNREKNLVCNKYSYLVGKCAREGGSDPKLNTKLASLMEQGKRNNVPSATMENAIKKALSKKLKPGTMELLGPGGCMIILEYESDNISEIRHCIKAACRKYGASSMSGEGRWRACFEKKGIIRAVGQLDGQPMDSEQALDAAIEAGAEEVKTLEDESEKTVFEFISTEQDLHSVKKELAKKYDLEDAYIGYVPIVMKELSKGDMELTSNFLEELENMTEVVRIFENVQ